MDNAMLDYQALCCWLYVYVDVVFKNLTTLLQFNYSSPQLHAFDLISAHHFRWNLKYLRKYSIEKIMQNTKVNSPGEQRLGETWRIYIISKELYCFTLLLTNQVQIQV